MSNVSPSPEVSNGTKTKIQCVENCFAIKGVLASSDVSASWMHPTTLYSCFSGDDWTETTENYQFKSVGKGKVSLFCQILALISGKSLSLVSHSMSYISIQPIKHLQTQGFILKFPFNLANTGNLAKLVNLYAWELSNCEIKSPLKTITSATSFNKLHKFA